MTDAELMPRLSLQFSTSLKKNPKKLSTKDARCHSLKSEAAEIFIRKIWKEKKKKTISPLLSTPRSVCKNKGSSCKVCGRGKTSESSHTQAGRKKVSPLKEHDEEFGKTGWDLQCLCALRFSVSHMSWQRGERALKQSDYREVITFTPHFSRLFSPRLSFPSLLHTQTKLCSAGLFFCIAMNTNQQD